MNKVTIGTRELEVKRSNLRFKKEFDLPWKKAVRAAKSDEEMVDLWVDGFMMYVGHNEGVDAAFLLDNLPDNPGELFLQVRIASGQKVAAPGEAASP